MGASVVRRELFGIIAGVAWAGRVVFINGLLEKGHDLRENAIIMRSFVGNRRYKQPVCTPGRLSPHSARVDI
jgi:hypothetical protein